MSEFVVDGVTLEEFERYLRARGYSDAYIIDLVRVFKRLAREDPLISVKKANRYKANQVLKHVRAYKLLTGKLEV